MLHSHVHNLPVHSSLTYTFTVNKKAVDLAPLSSLIFVFTLVSRNGRFLQGHRILFIICLNTQCIELDDLEIQQLAS